MRNVEHMTNKEKFIKWFMGEIGELGRYNCVTCRVIGSHGQMKNAGAYPDPDKVVIGGRPEAFKKVVEAKLIELDLEFRGNVYLKEISFDSVCFEPEYFFNLIKKRAAK